MRDMSYEQAKAAEALALLQCGASVVSVVDAIGCDRRVLAEWLYHHTPNPPRLTKAFILLALLAGRTVCPSQAAGELGLTEKKAWWLLESAAEFKQITRVRGDQVIYQIGGKPYAHPKEPDASTQYSGAAAPAAAAPAADPQRSGAAGADPPREGAAAGPPPAPEGRGQVEANKVWVRKIQTLEKEKAKLEAEVARSKALYQEAMALVRSSAREHLQTIKGLQKELDRQKKIREQLGLLLKEAE